ncbi:hypothetical protein GW17_00044518 [Ensete ventricosum]|nr:hypothetical protein GW17_00044518 [Ensete ventricosum]
MTRGVTMVELDFFRIEKENAAGFRGVERRGSSVRGPPSLLAYLSHSFLLASDRCTRFAFWFRHPERDLRYQPSASPDHDRPRCRLERRSASIVGGDHHVLPLPVSVDDAGSKSVLPAEVILKLAEEGDARNGHAGGDRQKLTSSTVFVIESSPPFFFFFLSCRPTADGAAEFAAAIPREAQAEVTSSQTWETPPCSHRLR